VSEKVYIGIDNGVTGSIGIIDRGSAYIYSMPVVYEQSYTKKKQMITRVNFDEFVKILSPYKNKNVLVVIERPMVNPARFKATISAIRCLEAVLICIEQNKFPRIYCDSKEWQKELLPKNVDKKDLKRISLDVARRFFPKVDFAKIKDGDALLIAEWARRHNL